MSPTRWVSWGATLFASMVSVSAFAHAPQDPVPDPATVFAELQAEFQSAQEEFYAPFKAAKTDEEMAEIQIDWSKDPSIAYAAKFKDFATKYEGTEPAAEALLAYMSMERNDRAAVLEQAERFVELYADSPSAEGFARSLPMFGWMLGQDGVVKLTTALFERATNGEVKAHALFARAQSQMSSDMAMARADFDRLLKDFGETAAASSAEGSIFEMEHLQIGMVAPDFETTDQDGKPWKLSDYRGKVVVIDFWGFW
ncbi:MAG: redoxin domain-containing protein [Planctomycetes bacterium]|nr:redoxin domain-containing protein [Planctomycetota bacterium]MCC7168964.1 redoxin domain-containing protein [Planctomycetota bacterium]